MADRQTIGKLRLPLPPGMSCDFAFALAERDS